MSGCRCFFLIAGESKKRGHDPWSTKSNRYDVPWSNTAAHSDRIYLMKLHDEDMPEILQDLDDLAAEQGYSKIFAKIPVKFLDEFKQHGYVNEALVPKFFRGQEDGVFVSRFMQG